MENAVATDGSNLVDPWAKAVGVDAPKRHEVVIVTGKWYRTCISGDTVQV